MDISSTDDTSDFLVKSISPIHRYGVQTLREIKKNTKIIEYTGDRISKDEKEKRDQMMKLNDENEFYFFQINKNLFIDGKNGNLSKYINHSCNPNCSSFIKDKRVFYRSIKDIKPYEELTIDYGMSFFDDGILCKCGSSNCRNSSTELNEEAAVQPTVGLMIRTPAQRKQYYEQPFNKQEEEQVADDYDDYDNNDDEVQSVVQMEEDRKDGKPSPATIELMNAESISIEEREEEINEIINNLMNDQRNFVNAIQNKNEEFRFIIDCILSNFKCIVRITKKKQPIFGHYVRVSDFNERLNEDCKEIIFQNKFFSRENLGKILNSCFTRVVKKELKIDNSDRPKVYLNLVQRRYKLVANC